ncbi:hypothetical protein EON65_08705 [archaeon]|nr:MAG: hypothetical protein EON65_08705 [archaeon]
MCLDILIQLLGGQRSWQSESLAILEELYTIASELYKQVEKCDAAKYLADAKKLLGSLFLCIATTCRVLGAGSLHHLPVRKVYFYSIFLLTSLSIAFL